MGGQSSSRGRAGQTHLRHPLHGDDRQPAIWLDAFRQSDRGKQWLAIAAIQLAFSIFIALETWLTPIEGWIVDQLGPRGPKIVVAFGGIFVAIGWVINAKAETLTLLYFGAVVGGIGGGAVYATCVGNRREMVSRSPRPCGRSHRRRLWRRRGVDRHSHSICDQHRAATKRPSSGSRLVQGGVVFVLAWFLRAPVPGEMAGAPPSKVTAVFAATIRRPRCWPRRYSGFSTSCS